jgi:putative aldouronate transport system substrate-binding protein
MNAEERRNGGQPRLLLLVAGVFLAAILLPGAMAFAQAKSTQPLFTYTAFPRMPESEKYINNPHDVVTPYVESLFNIKVSDVIIASNTIQFKQRYNQMAAADDVPDVITSGKADTDYAVASGLYADLTDYIKGMKNYNKYFDQKYLPMYLNDGRQYQISDIELNLNDPKYDADPYNLGAPNWCLWAREDILAKCGYKFTPMADIQKKAAATGKKPLIGDYAITPAIDTPAKFVALLRKIKALNLKVGDKAVIPLSVTSWQQFHLGCQFAFGHWHKYDDGTIAGFLESPGTKDWYKDLWTINHEGLIDPDWLVQKEEQLQEKASAGLVAVGMYLSDIPAARANMLKVNPAYQIRYIPWPKTDPNTGFFDVYAGGFERTVISKKVKDIARLTQYFDWFFSDEGLNILTWGPPNTGVWKMDGSKKIFADKSVEQDMLTGAKGKKGADYYGLYDYTSYILPYLSKAGLCAAKLMVGNPMTYLKSYPVNIDAFTYARSLFGRNGMDYSGKGTYGDGGDNDSAWQNYFWGKWQNDRVAKLMQAGSDAEFSTVFDQQRALWQDEGKWDGAHADMVKWFAQNTK